MLIVLTRRASITSAALAILLMTTAGVAHAAWVNYFSFNATSGYGGSGETTGEIIYTSANNSKYSVSGSVRDICPADGKGIALRVRARSAGGAENIQTIIKDTNECGPNAVVQNTPLNFFTPFNIDDSRAELWTTEGGTPYIFIGSSTWKNRP